MKPHQKFRIILFISAMFTLLMFSCATKPTEKDIAWKYVQTNPTDFAEWCKERFPNVITEYIPGTREIIPLEILVPGDSIPCPKPSDTNPAPYVKVPDKTIAVTTEKCTPDTIKIADTRDLQIANDKVKKAEQDREWWKNQYHDQVDLYNKELATNKKLSDDNATLKVERNTGYWIAGVLFLVICFFILFKVFRK